SDAALSPDGKLLAVGIRAYRAPRRLLRLLDTVNGGLVREVKLEGAGWFVSLAFSRDGKALALGSRDEIAVVDVATGKTLNRLGDRMSPVAFVGFTPDGNRLVSHSHDNKFRLWDLGTGKVLQRVDAEASGHFEYPQFSSAFRKPSPPEKICKAHSTMLSPDGK